MYKLILKVPWFCPSWAWVVISHPETLFELIEEMVGSVQVASPGVNESEIVSALLCNSQVAKTSSSVS